MSQQGGGPKKSKISQVKKFPKWGGGWGGEGSGNLGTVPKLYLVINYEGFPNCTLGPHCLSKNANLQNKIQNGKIWGYIPTGGWVKMLKDLLMVSKIIS